MCPNWSILMGKEIRLLRRLLIPRIEQQEAGREEGDDLYCFLDIECYACLICYLFVRFFIW